MSGREAEKRLLLQMLREDPDFLTEVRSLILPAELLQLPQRFAEFAAQVMEFIRRQEELNAQFLAFMQRQEGFNQRQEDFNQRQEEFNQRQEEFNQRQEGFNQRQETTNQRQEGFNQRQEEFNQRQEEFNQRQEEFNQRQEEFNQRQETTNQRQEEFNQRQEEFNQRQEEFNQRQEGFNQRQETTNQSVQDRLQRITDDLGDLKGHVAGRIAREMSDDIAEHLGFEITEQLNGKDLRQMVRQQRPSDLPSGARRSFYNADLVARVIDPAGNESFIAVEASYTADRRDSDRAQRNAALLTQFTGIPATPVVASLRNDHAVAELVEEQAILWYQFETKDLRPD